jgi:hypothetical protein
MPPYLAGRKEEELEFKRLLRQSTILENIVITGLRGVGKTVLLESLKPVAIREGWMWVGTDLSESVSISEENLATRILTDIAVLTSRITISLPNTKAAGFIESTDKTTLNYAYLRNIYEGTPGLVSDKLKYVLEYIWAFIQPLNKNGVIFAYDEAQNMSNQAQKEEYPLSLLLDVFQSLQRKNVCFMLVLTGLPTLFPKLVDARTFSERMFHVLFLKRLSKEDTREAILKPIQDANCPARFNEESVGIIVDMSGGYPYFIQFICKEVYDTWLQQIEAGEDTIVPANEIINKLDSDFYAGRWARVTERQKELLWVIASLTTGNSEFTGSEITEASRSLLEKRISTSQVNQMLSRLSNAGLVFKNRHGKYCFAVPLFGQYILRTMATTTTTTTTTV